MNNKHWYLSKGVIGGVVAFVCGVLLTTGVLNEQVAEADINTIADKIVAIVGALAALVAIIGRITAKAKITK